MKKIAIALPSLVLLVAGCKSEPVVLHTFDGSTMVYPDDLPNDKPTILAFLNVNDRSCDNVIRPLRALSAQEQVGILGVMTYTDNSFLRQISTQDEIVFPVMLDPREKLVDRFGVHRYPTFVLLSVDGSEIDRRYDVKKLNDWYRGEWYSKGMNRRHVPTREEMVEE